MLTNKVKLFALTALLFTFNSCSKKECDCKSSKSDNAVSEKIVLKEPTSFNGTPKNIIFMVGDGMGLTQITSGLTKKRDFLHLARCKHIGFSKTQSSSDYITDSAAGATAFSIGKKTYNGAIGVNKDTLPEKTILEIAEAEGLATGMVATSSITHATPASFIAHQPSRNMHEEIALDFLKTDIEVFIGGGVNYFEKRTDGINLSDELKSKGYQMVYNMEELEKVSSGKIAGLMAEAGMPKMSEGRGEFLTKASMKAINNLSTSEKGFFLMIEGSQIDWGGHEMNSEYIISEMVDFDNAIGKVLDFADKDGETLVVITADHETGGYSIVDGSMEEGTVKGEFTTDHHTATMVPVFAYGPGADAFMGMYHNNTIFDKFMNLYGFKK